MTTWRLLVGDVRERLAELPDASVQCCVTSPPYWGLRDYGVAGQLGLNETPTEYVNGLVAVMGEVRRVLSDDGTLWLNLGDSYQNAKGQAGGVDPKQSARRHGLRPQDKSIRGLKAKDMVGIPWLVAFALRSDGWWLRRDIIWAKGLSFLPAFSGSVMPEAATDRPTTSHEYIFLLSKRRRYYYDADAIKEPASLALASQVEQGYAGAATKNYASAGAQDPSAVKARIIDNRRRRAAHPRGHGVNPQARAGALGSRQNASFSAAVCDLVDDRNARSVWVIPTQPYPDAHYATFPEGVPEKCIKAGTRLGDTVLDPFCGSGTTGQVAIQLGRSFIGVELNPTYAQLARERIGGAAPLFATEATA